MLMDGNRSTGMRTKLVTPITTRTRQTTIMKYGLRMEKRGMAQSAYYLAGAPAIHQQVSCRNDKHGENHRGCQPADNGARQRGVLFAAGPEFQRHRDHADDGGQ